MASNNAHKDSVKNFDVNGYLSDIIHKDRLEYTEKSKKTNTKGVSFYSDDVNHELTRLDITV